MMSNPPSPITLVLSRADVAALIGVTDCRLAVEEAFRRYGAGEVAKPGVLGCHVAGGGFHIKTGLYRTATGEVFVAKTNANFPSNPAQQQLPTIQGAIAVFDARCGILLAVMDSIEVTVLRTAAATAVAARHLARHDASVVTIVGCGTQGWAHLLALAEVRPLARVYLWDIEPSRAVALADRWRTRRSGIAVSSVADLTAATRTSDIVVTCTPSRDYLLGPGDVSPGTFVAGVGVDNEEKRELAPELLANSRVVVDVLDQCAAFGDLHHALDAGVMRREDVHAELGAIVAGAAPGRSRDDEVMVFDSTGMALQDAATAALVLQRATEAGRGLSLALGALDS